MAKKLVNTKKISHEEWLATRKRSIGGSDASAIIGMNPYKSTYSLYLDKTGVSKDAESNEAMRLGNDLEAYVAERYTEETGKKVRNDNYMYQDDDYDFITANIDRVIVGENAGLECKTMSSFNGYDLENGEIPSQYYVQCQHYMMVMGYEYMDIAILVFQRGIYIHTVPRSDEFIKALREAEIEFWTKFVVLGVAPALDGSDATMDALKEAYAEDMPASDLFLDNIDDLVSQYNYFKEQEDLNKDKKKEAQAKICKLLGDFNTSTAHGNRFKASWKTTSTTRLDSTKLKAERPDVYEEFAKTSTSKRFSAGNAKKERK